MDQGTLVTDQVYDGRRFVEQFAADGNPVQAAFWVKTAEDEDWYLYVASDLFEREGPAAAYRAVHASLQKIGESSLSSSEIKVIGPSDPLAKDVLALLSRLPARSVTRLGTRTLGSIAVEQVIVYPHHYYLNTTRAHPMTSEEVGREIIRLMNGGPGTTPMPRVELKDGTFFDGVPISVAREDSQGATVGRFVVVGEPSPRLVRLDDIAAIR